MRRWLLVVLLPWACRRSAPDLKPDEAAAKSPVTCTVPEGATAEIPARCHLEVANTLTIRAGQRLTIGAGARVTFKPGARLVVVGGTLIARGTKPEPVKLAFVGDDGVELGGVTGQVDAGTTADAGIAPESTLELASIEKGFVRAAGSARLRLVDVTFAGTAVRIESEDSLVDATRVSFDGGELDAPPAMVARYSAHSLAKTKVRLHGRVEGNVTLPALTTYESDSLVIRDGALEFPERAVVRMRKGATLRAVGTTERHPRFVAKNVTFTSAAAAPAPGDWMGFILHQTDTRLEGCTVEYAGADSTLDAAVNFVFDHKGTNITKTTFKNNRGAGISASSAGCALFDAPAAGNTSAGQSLCTLSVNAYGAFGPLHVETKPGVGGSGAPPP